jgi:hypothetical protein
MKLTVLRGQLSFNWQLLPSNGKGFCLVGVDQNAASLYLARSFVAIFKVVSSWN